MKNPEATNIVIGGGGIAGLYAAIRLTEEGNYVTVYDPNKESNPNAVATTPIINIYTAALLGLNVPQEYITPQFDSENIYLPLLGGPAIDPPLCAVRMQDMLEHLHYRAQEAGIQINSSRIDSLAIESGRVQGVHVNNQFIQADLVIDATGKNAHLIRNQNIPVEEIKHPEPTALIGMYINLQNIKRPNQLNNESTAYMGYLSGKLVYFMFPVVPSQFESNTGTHVVFIEGNRERIEAVYKRHKVSKGPVSRLNAMKELSQGTYLGNIFNQVDEKQIESTTYSSFSEAVFRNVAMERLVLIGEAQGHNNPLFGKGIKAACKDVEVLIAALSASNGNIDLAIQNYRETQKQRYTQGFEKSQRNYNLIMKYLEDMNM